MKIQKQIGEGGWGGGQGGCERRSEVFVKIQKKIGGGGQGGCERRIDVFCENSILKKNRGGGGGGWLGWGVRVDVNGELNFL